MATGFASLAYSWRVEPHWIEIVERSMPLARLPRELVGKRIAQISDLHVGPVVDQQYITAAVGRVAELRADMIVVTGDFMTCYENESVDQTLEVMHALPPAPLGRFAVLGNHDYGYQWRANKAANQLSSGLEKLDVRVLRNELVQVDGLQVVGVDDLYSTRFAPAMALSTFDQTRPGIALCHNPDSVDQRAMQSFRGWVLSGHTHGGQFKPPLLAPPILPVNNRRYTSGEIALSGQRRLYINRGLGYSERLRFNCRPEITVFTLTNAA